MSEPTRDTRKWEYQALIPESWRREPYNLWGDIDHDGEEEPIMESEWEEMAADGDVTAEEWLNAPYGDSFAGTEAERQAVLSASGGQQADRPVLIADGSTIQWVDTNNDNVDDRTQQGADFAPADFSLPSDAKAGLPGWLRSELFPTESSSGPSDSTTSSTSSGSSSGGSGGGLSRAEMAGAAAVVAVVALAFTQR